MAAERAEVILVEVRVRAKVRVAGATAGAEAV